MDKFSSHWYKLLTLFEQLNHLVKENEWYNEDVEEFYALKDQFLNLIYTIKPPEIKISLFYVPYYKYSNVTKDKAGEIMRNDIEKNPFEFYLHQVELCSQDIEIKEKATIELEIISENRMFSFHIPLANTAKWDIDMKSVQNKNWISGKEFHRNQFKKLKEEIAELLDILN